MTSEKEDFESKVEHILLLIFCLLAGIIWYFSNFGWALVFTLGLVGLNLVLTIWEARKNAVKSRSNKQDG